VIDRKDVPPDEALRFRVDVVGDSAARVCRLYCHVRYSL